MREVSGSVTQLLLIQYLNGSIAPRGRVTIPGAGFVRVETVPVPVRLGLVGIVRPGESRNLALRGLTCCWRR